MGLKGKLVLENSGLELNEAYVNIVYVYVYKDKSKALFNVYANEQARIEGKSIIQERFIDISVEDMKSGMAFDVAYAKLKEQDYFKDMINYDIPVKVVEEEKEEIVV